MKLRSSSLDAVFEELQFTLDDDGRPLARITRYIFTWGYRAFRGAMLAALRLSWRRDALSREAQA
jgi:hypothetical protein